MAPQPVLLSLQQSPSDTYRSGSRVDIAVQLSVVSLNPGIVNFIHSKRKHGTVILKVGSSQTEDVLMKCKSLNNFLVPNVEKAKAESGDEVLRRPCCFATQISQNATPASYCAYTIKA